MRYLPFGTGSCWCCNRMDLGLGVIVMGSLICGGGGCSSIVGSVGAVAFRDVYVIVELKFGRCALLVSVSRW